jgi:hypothetical protein
MAPLIRVAWVRWEAVEPASWERLRRFSTEWEQETALGMADPVRAAAWLGGRGLLRWLVVETLGVANAQTQSVLRWSPAGRPFVDGHPDVGVSLSRADGLALAAVCSRGSIGVDVESIYRFAGDRRDAREWCLWEAWCKASGVGLDCLETAGWETAGDVQEGLVPVDVLETPGSVDNRGVGSWQWTELALPDRWVAVLVHPADSPVTVEAVEGCFGTIAP